MHFFTPFVLIGVVVAWPLCTEPVGHLADPKRVLESIRRPRRYALSHLEDVDGTEATLAAWNQIGGTLGLWHIARDAGRLFLLATAIKVWRDDPQNYQTLGQRLALISICFIGSSFESLVARFLPAQPRNAALLAVQQYLCMCSEVNCQIEFVRPDLIDAARKRL